MHCSEQRKKNWLYCTFSFLFLFFNRKHGRCILCLVILGVLPFFCLEGDGASQAIQREHGSRGHSQWKELGMRHPEEKKPNSMSFWVNTQVGKETYLNSHHLLSYWRMSLQASSPHQPAIWTASLSSAWDEPAKPDWPEDSLSQRRRCLKQIWNNCFLHCRGLPTR